MEVLAVSVARGKAATAYLRVVRGLSKAGKLEQSCRPLCMSDGEIDTERHSET